MTFGEHSGGGGGDWLALEVSIRNVTTIIVILMVQLQVIGCTCFQLERFPETG